MTCRAVRIERRSDRFQLRGKEQMAQPNIGIVGLLNGGAVSAVRVEIELERAES